MSSAVDPLAGLSDEEFADKMNNGEFDDELMEDTEEEEAEAVDAEEETPEVAEAEPEQPDTDSVTVSETDEVDGETEDSPSDAEEENADSEEAEENGKLDEAEATNKPVEDDVLTEYLNAKSKVKASGAEFEFTNAEKLENFDKIYQQAMDYTKKTQAIAPYRKRIATMEEMGITDAQFNTMLDVLKGDKDAITSVIKQAGLDTLELDTESELNYVPNEYGKSDKELDISEVFNELQTAPKGDVTTDIITSRWDDRSRDKIVEGIALPNGKTLGTVDIIKGLQYDVENDIYDTVMPEMLKMKQMDNARKSDIEYYIEAGAAINYRNEVAQRDKELKANAEAKLIADTKAKQAAKNKANAVAKRKKDAAVSQGASGAGKVTDYLDMAATSDEDFLAFMEKQIG